MKSTKETPIQALGSSSPDHLPGPRLDDRPVSGPGAEDRPPGSGTRGNTLRCLGPSGLFEADTGDAPALTSHPSARHQAAHSPTGSLLPGTGSKSATGAHFARGQ